MLGAGWLWRRRSAALGRVRDELAVSEATKRMGELRSARVEVERQVGDNAAAIASIDAQIAVERRKFVEAHDVDQDISDEELNRRLREVLGE